MTKDMHTTILILTGELSGDEHMAHHIPSIRKAWPHAKLIALGGPALVKQEVECFATIDQLNIMGFFSLLKRLPTLLHLLWRTKCMFHRYKPNLTLMVDAPAFNLRFLPLAKRYGKVLYYISPKVWAHGEKRIQTMRQHIDHLALIFPFEKDYFKKHAMPSTYVGNPVYQKPLPAKDQIDARNQLNIDPKRHVVGLLPGSRPQEIKCLLPIFVQMVEHYPHHDTLFLLPIAPSLDASHFHPYLDKSRIQIMQCDSKLVMQASDFLIVASGTATLEAAYCQTPMSIVYKTSKLTEYWVRHHVTLQHIGLPNILAQKTIAPERLQEAFNVQQLIEDIDTHRPQHIAHQKQKKALQELAQSIKKSEKTLTDLISDCLDQEKSSCQ